MLIGMAATKLAIFRPGVICLFMLTVSACAATQQSTHACAPPSASYNDLNARQFFDAYVVCSRSGESKNAALMIVLGQIRALSDMTVLTPVDETDQQKIAKLYSDFFYKFGGLGDDELYRNAETVEALISAIQDVSLVYRAGYDPGWKYKGTSKTDIYDQVADYKKRYRVWQIRNFALLLQHDVYYAAYRAVSELPRTLQQGTPEYDESQLLQKIMHEVEAGIEKLPAPEDTTPYERLYEPDPDASFRQIGRGFNGLERSLIQIFRTEDEARGSWLKRAYSAEQLKALIAAVDFDKEVLISVNIGKRMNASDTVLITRLGYSNNSHGYRVSTVVGVVPESCGLEFAESFPFALAVTKAGPQAEIRSSSSSNFPTDCGQIRSGISSDIR